MYKGPGQIFLQRRYIYGQKHEKMFKIIGYYGNTNQNHNEISLYTLWDGFNQKVKITSIGKDVEK